ncbi:MAG: hypothetical protein ACP5IT_11700, partial [Thermoproteota archaeon]
TLQLSPNFASSGASTLIDRPKKITRCPFVDGLDKTKGNNELSKNKLTIKLRTVLFILSFF